MLVKEADVGFSNFFTNVGGNQGIASVISDIQRHLVTFSDASRKFANVWESVCKRHMATMIDYLGQY